MLFVTMSTVLCPVCNTPIPTAEIEFHVELCLAGLGTLTMSDIEAALELNGRLDMTGGGVRRHEPTTLYHYPIYTILYPYLHSQYMADHFVFYPSLNGDFPALH